MTEGPPLGRLSAIIRELIDAGALLEVCRAIETGKLTASSTAATRSALARGNARVEPLLVAIQREWNALEPAFGNAPFAVALRLAAEVIAVERRVAPATEIVWTGPPVEGSFVRATREVVRELVRGASRELLLVGYWIAARDEAEGIIEEFVELVAGASARGVVVTAIFDERRRPDGRDNRDILLDVWPKTVPFPNLFTWKLPIDDRHLKLHAKVLVADGADALVTSANLTWYAMDKNIEMGVRINAAPAAAIERHFRLLLSGGLLQAY